MPVKVNIDLGALENKLNRTVKNGMGMISSIILRDCNKYCKEDTGMLIASSLIHSRLNDGLLIWQTPYAARQYYAIPTAYHDVNSNATWRWCEVAKNNHQATWVKQAQAIMRYYG